MPSLHELYNFFVELVAKDQLPAFLVGMSLGILLVLFVIKLTRVRRSDGLVNELRDTIDRSKADHQGLIAENQKLESMIEAVNRERDLHKDQVAGREGKIEALSQRIQELSAACESRSTELFDTREVLKQERKERRALKKLVEAYSKQLDEITNSDGKIWLKPTNTHKIPFLPMSVRKTAIISLANLKGGVGKTTIAANIGAALASDGLRVLLIDLDHQSSLTNLCLTPTEKRDVLVSHKYIDNLFDGGGDLTALNKCITRLEVKTGEGQLYLAPVHEDFADVENRLMTRWHSGLSHEDVRFRLRGALHSARLREFYDIVLIDCPPRLTTGTVNALAASDYVLIPVLLEGTSAEGVPRILGWLKRFQEVSCLELNVLGVVGNKANPRNTLINREANIWDSMRDPCLKAWGGPVHFFAEVIREHSTFTGRFASLDPRHQPRYQNLITMIRREIPNAHLEPVAVPPLAGSSLNGGRP